MVKALSDEQQKFALLSGPQRGVETEKKLFKERTILLNQNKNFKIFLI